MGLAATFGALVVVNSALDSGESQAWATWFGALGTIAVSVFLAYLARATHRIERDRARREAENDWKGTWPVLEFDSVETGDNDAPTFRLRNAGGSTANQVRAWFTLVPFVGNGPEKTLDVIWTHGDPTRDSLRPGEFVEGCLDAASFEETVSGELFWWTNAGIIAIDAEGLAEAWLLYEFAVGWHRHPWGLHRGRHAARRLGARPEGRPPWERRD